MEFSTRSIHGMISDQGDKRVSKDAINQLRQVLETFSGDIAEEALAIAEEEGYQTVKGKHVRQALK